MATITFTIPDDKIQRVVNAMKGLYPIPMINNGTVENPNLVPEFTDSQWAKERVRRFIRDTVARYEQRVAIESVKYTPDNDIAS